MTLDLEDLQRKAEAATPGPWEWCPQTPPQMGYFNSPGLPVCDFGDAQQYYPTEGAPPSDEDAAFIAAANPAVILALIAELKEARQICCDLYQVIGALADEAGLFGDPQVSKAMDTAISVVEDDYERHDDLLPFNPQSPLRAKCEKMLAALGPFADEAGEWDDCEEPLSDKYFPLIGHEQDTKMAKATFTLGDLRRARKALAELDGGADG